MHRWISASVPCQQITTDGETEAAEHGRELQGIADNQVALTFRLNLGVFDDPLGCVHTHFHIGILSNHRDGDRGCIAVRDSRQSSE